MSSLLECKQIQVHINRPADWVYDFAAKPTNMPYWASGLSGEIHKIGADWVSNSPMGQVTIHFTPRNPFGVLDHDVVLPDGKQVHNPLRVMPNGQGSTVVFSLFRQPEMSSEKFAEDQVWVEKDLNKLKEILERT